MDEKWLSLGSSTLQIAPPKITVTNASTIANLCGDREKVVELICSGIRFLGVLTREEVWFIANALELGVAKVDITPEPEI